MIGLPSSVRIFVAVEWIDMRKGLDALAGLIRQHGGDPFSGHLYVFLSRHADRVKILVWDRGGFVVWYKRLERGSFARPVAPAVGRTIELDAGQLAMLLDGVDFSRVRRGRRWEPARAA